MANLQDEECSSGTPSPVTSSAPSGTLTRMSSFELHPPAAGPHLGDVLVIGGCGFLGHHVVKFLLKEQEEQTCTSITVMCRSPFKNLFPGVKYHIGDITNLDHCRHVISKVQPKVIINTASPHAYKDHEHVPDIFKVNINGNQNLLQAAVETGTVQAYIYTSSAPIIAGSGGGYDHADETYPTLAFPKPRKGDPYHVAKALGDKIVLEANLKYGFRTCCIRPTALYGEGDGQMIGPTMKALEDGNQGIWMGYNDIDMDVVYVGHVAIAEVLAAKAMLNEILDSNATVVSGEAFNITDDQPSPPLTFFRKYWTLAGDETPLSSIWYIPPVIVLIMAHIAEWVCWAVTWGKGRPTDLILERMEFILYTRTYSVKKAREMLGFVPWKDQDYRSQEEALKGSVEWFLKPENHGPVKTGVYPSWSETPFKLISQTGALTKPSIPPDHHCIPAARFMAQTHNTIFRALNSIYHHSFLVTPGTQATASLLSYCAITYEFMHHHQLVEENFYFPALEAASGIKDLMKENVSQHEAMDMGMEAFRRYAETTRKDSFNGQKLRDCIDAFKEAYEKHQHQEIGTILGLGKHIDSKTLKQIDMQMRDEAEKQSDVFKAAPFVLTAQDSHHLLDGLSIPYPKDSPLLHRSNIIPLIVSLILSSRHSSAWSFAPSTIYGKPKLCPQIIEVEQGSSKGKAIDNFIDGVEVYEKGMKMGISSAWRWVEDLREKRPSTQILISFLIAFGAWLMFA